MPKHKIDHPAGSHVPDDLRELLLRFFPPADVSRLERLGGRVTVGLTAPYVTKEQREKFEVEFDDKYREHLRSMRYSPEDLEHELGKLSVKQLRELGRFLGHPLRTKASRQEHLWELTNHFVSEEKWKAISGEDISPSN